MYIYFILFFIIGIILGSIYTSIGYRLPIKDKLFRKSKCDYCSTNLKLVEQIPIFSFIFQRGRCNYCHKKISILYPIFELLTGIIFIFLYNKYYNYNNSTINILISSIFVSILIIIMYSDIKYMIIPDKLLLFSSFILILSKLFLDYLDGNINNYLDAGYDIIFMLLDAFIMFVIMYMIKKIGDLLFKKDSLGGGDLKMMALISLFLGYKTSIVIIFLASFIALPISIITTYKKNNLLIPFGPYLSIITIFLYINSIDYNTIINLIR